ncbi:hypothetical protein [Mesobacillus jeotgali]|uniref:Uncharacterized protein n=1 Tax=Mesobacillus jeotgali TaxID=129985 RepID=A0ABY9VP62_9BACI|nr:hypothetical protein [Mesobacillus jeotgali]WNF24929.1 hypothetical protein RH061_10770 [Mesobacillus jeotgali]
MGREIHFGENELILKLTGLTGYFAVFDAINYPKVDGIACPELVDYNVRI